MRVVINDPEHSGLHFFGGGAERDTQGRYIYFMSTKIGEVQGFPLYRNKDGFDTLILNNNRKPIWLPLPQEEFLKLEIRRMEKELAESGPIGQDPSNPYRQRLERHKALLAGMPPSERQAQAVYLPNENVLDPDLAPSGSEEGLPLVVANRDWYDPAVPRTAIQLIAVTFACNLIDDPNDTGPPTEDLPVSCLRLWETKQTSDWKAVSAVLRP